MAQQVYTNTIEEPRLEHYPWYFGAITREEANRILLNRGKLEGTFLIRDELPKSASSEFRLSVLVWERVCKVLHFRIQRNEQMRYFINSSVDFTSLANLVHHYTVNKRDRVIQLTVPCTNDAPHDVNIPKEFELRKVLLMMSKHVSTSRTKCVDVWKGMYMSLPVAVKVQKHEADETRERLQEEAAILITLRHCNIVRLVGVVTSYPFCVVTEYQANGDLLSYTLNDDQYETTVNSLLVIAQEVASALSYVADMGYVHRNVRAANVLLDGDLNCKLAGFGYAAKLNSNGFYFTTEDDTPIDPMMYRWMAIEGALHGRFSTHSDVWSYSVFLHELFTKGERPYADLLMPQVVGEVQNGRRLQQGHTVPDSVFELMQKCWRTEPEERLTFATIIDTIESLLARQNVFHSKSPSVPPRIPVNRYIT